MLIIHCLVYFTPLLLIQVNVSNGDNGMFTVTWHGVKVTYPYSDHCRYIHRVYTVSSLSYFIVNICVYLLYIITIETTVHGLQSFTVIQEFMCEYESFTRII